MPLDEPTVATRIDRVRFDIGLTVLNVVGIPRFQVTPPMWGPVLVINLFPTEVHKRARTAVRNALGLAVPLETQHRVEGKCATKPFGLDATHM